MRSITRKLFICLLIVSTAGICQYGSQDIKKSSSKSFRFAWPIPSKVFVNETFLINGKTAQRRYTLDIARVKGGAVISFKDIEFLRIQGIDVTTPGMKRRLGPILEVMEYIPSFRIQSDGQLVEIQGIEEMLDQMFKLDTDFKYFIEPGVLQTLRSPKYKKSMDQMIATYWYIWAGLWREVNISPGETLETEVVPSLLRIPLHQSSKAKIMHLGPALGHPGKVKLGCLIQHELTKESMHKINQGLMEIGKESGIQLKEMPECENFKLGVFIEIIMDPNRLMPYYVKYEKNATATSKYGESGSWVERNEYTFDWSPKDIKPTLTCKSRVVKPGGFILVHFTAPADYTYSAWVGIIPSHIPHGLETENDRHDLSYKYLKKRTRGTLFFTAPMKPGNYDFRMNDSDMGGKEVCSISFTVKASVTEKATTKKASDLEALEMLLEKRIKNRSDRKAGQSKKAIKIPSDRIPRLIKKTKPRYPEVALRARIQGKVIIEGVTDIYGRVVSAEAIEGHELLRSAAEEAVKKWEYEPYVLNGIPRAVRFTVEVEFSLNRK